MAEKADVAIGTARPGGVRALAALRSLTLEEKVGLLTGRDMWTTWPIERVGLRSIVFSDGPSGVRGMRWDEREPSLNLPSATALASSWDVGLARRYGAALAVEARRKGVDAVLGPTINLHRSPRGGRHFESFSEDAVLTAELAAAYTRGLQENGVGATLKHYVANDSETDRFVVDVRVGERALRELYLLAFEKAVVEAGAWLVMSAYNSVNGTTMTENALLERPLAADWGFDGAVISDWTAVRSLEAAWAAQDLVMPGPHGPWGDALVAAVRSGAIDEAVIDGKVLRILTLAERVGALAGGEPAPIVGIEDGVALAREVAVEGMVLLENRGELPWNRAVLGSVAVIGANAAYARTQGGGSATVLPDHVVSPLEGLRAALPDVDVTHSPGALVQGALAELPLGEIANPVTGEPGVRVRFLDADGAELCVEDRRSTALVYLGGDAPVAAASRFELTTTWTPGESGRFLLGFAAVGTGRIAVGRSVVLDDTVSPTPGGDVGSSLLGPPAATVEIDLVAGAPLELRFEFELAGRVGPLAHVLAVRLGTSRVVDEERLIADAAEAARAADVALVVVGTNEHVESEGFDRESLALPGRQDELVAAVAAANPRTVVLVNAGAPVLMPWRDGVAAVLVGWFGGQEFGTALADVLLGDAEPGGRLPTTWPACEEDVPVLSTTPADGALHYDEGVHVGYRAWLRSSAQPAYPFGSGLGYTNIAVRAARAPDDASVGETVVVSVDVENEGARAGKQIVQVYAERPHSAVERPVRWLVGFSPVRVGAGERASVAVVAPTRLLAYWDDGWRYEEGRYTLRIGTSVDDLPLAVELDLASG